LIEAGIESRYSLAAQALYDAMPEIQSWEVLAGYLLYDHSQPATNGASDDPETMLRQYCQLEEKHETVLLDILNATVRSRLQRLAQAQNDKKKTKAQRESDKEDQADMARRLSLLIPQLLKKFGALPEAAALCLRLERELNLDVFQELRQNAALTALLDDISKQFLTHHNERVLAEAIGSIQHAQGNDELKDLVALKVQSLWDDIINTFDALRRGKNFATRGNLDHNILVGVSNVVSKMAQLAKVSDASVLDNIAAPTKSKGRGKKAALEDPPITSLLEILDRGILGESLDSEIDEVEDVLVRHAMSLTLVYFAWKCTYCMSHLEEGTSLPDDELTAIVERRDGCVMVLMRIIESRKGADEVRLDAANLLLDIYFMFRSLQNKKGKIAKTPRKPQGRGHNDANDDWEALCQDIDGNTIKTLLQILTACENSLAKLTNKRLEEPDVDDDPIDPDDEPESDDEDADDENIQADKYRRTTLAERALCTFGGHLVRAVVVGSLGIEGEKVVRARLERNKMKLTPAWKEVVNELDAFKHARKGAKTGGKAAKESTKPSKSKEIVIEDDSEEEELEVQGDEIEDEEMDDGDAEQANGTDEVLENGDVEAEDDEEESVLGD
jgi:cohesin complex subunit SA-1/2